ncbi:ER membrane protein complex subunit 10 [Aphelenchoides fujianensis]|nr:ER membrane protein complex subunit 10 [Aphelenchoides fujianensis]
MMKTAMLVCLSLMSVGATRTWDLPLEVSVDQGPYSSLGKVELTMQADGNYTGVFAADRAVDVSKLYAKLMAADPHSFYSVRSGDVFSSNEVCLIARAQLQHEFALTLDSTRQKLISLTVYPHGLYDVGHEACSLEDLKSKQPSKLGGKIRVTNIGELPSGWRRKKRARQHGAQNQDNRSFFAKYWMYIVPAVIFLLVTNAMGTDQPQE